MRSLSLFFILLFSFLSVSTVTRADTADHPADAVDWKLLFNQLFTLEIKKELLGSQEYANSNSVFEQKLKDFTHYTPSTFTETINKVLKVDTSSQAYQCRRKHYEDSANYQKIRILDFDQSIPYSIRTHPHIATFLAAIEQHKNRPIPAEENFFRSPEAEAFFRAISFGKEGIGSQEVAFVLVPGYAAHAIKFDIFPEIVTDANLLSGRPASRPVLSERHGIDFEFEDFKSFYNRGTSGRERFDILHPAGAELGNTMGLNAESADLMAYWIQNLPEEYAQKKLILLGYSKGAPVVFEMLTRHPELQSRILGIVTYAGVIQGANIARRMMNEIDNYLGSNSLDSLVDKVETKGVDALLTTVAPFLGNLNMGIFRMPKIRSVMEIFDVDTTEMEGTKDRVVSGREIEELLDGAHDLWPYTRAAWNLKHFDNKMVPPNTFLFNLSAVTDLKAFVRPGGFDAKGKRRPSLIAPTLNAEGKINWKDFSLDALFLYLSSQEGFKMAPGGLYDTQVELQHTKTPWLDTSPLSATLTEDELVNLWKDDTIRARLTQNGITTFSQFKNTPRSELLAEHEKNHLQAYDLGEIKGHHWSLFLQAFRPQESESKEFAIWPFPRKALMRALLQTMALYNLINQQFARQGL